VQCGDDVFAAVRSPIISLSSRSTERRKEKGDLKRELRLLTCKLARHFVPVWGGGRKKNGKKTHPHPLPKAANRSGMPWQSDDLRPVNGGAARLGRGGGRERHWKGEKRRGWFPLMGGRMEEMMRLGQG